MVGRRISALRKRAFTLIEVLVVITIVAVLAALLMPALGAAKERARMVYCMNNLKQLTLANLIYAEDSRRMMCTANDYLTTTPPGWLLGPNVPTVVTNSILIQRKLINDKALFKCPSDRGIRLDAQAVKPALFSYARNGEVLGLYPDAASQVSLNVDTVPYPAKTTMLMELHDAHPFNDGTTMRWPGDWITNRHLGMGGMSFFDGHVVMLSASAYNNLAPDDRVELYLFPDD
jgi:prepilin-type N-terminal cleavage/methylation domain-containing protein/prepilin-type processing-associated H-X9-DG protein